MPVPDPVRSTSPALRDDPPFVRELRSVAQPVPQGGSGVTIYYGRVFGQEDNQDLIGPNWYGDMSQVGLAEEMCRTDPHCNSMLEIHKAPLIQATWDFSYPTLAKDPTPLQLEMQEFDRWNFFELLKWRQTVRQTMDYLRAGFSLLSVTTDIVEVPAERFPLHPSPEMPNGMKRVLAVTGLEQRTSRSVFQWVMDPDRPSRVAAVVQLVMKSDVNPGGRQTLETVDPANGAPRLLRFTFNPNGNNPEGVSLLRPAWGPYKIKKVLQLIDAMRHERQGLGIPQIRMPKGFTSNDEKIARQILDAVRSHERAYIVLPDGFVFEFNQTGSGKGTNIHEALERCNRDIWIAGRATFMLLGNGDTGSYAMSSNLSDRLNLDCEGHVDVTVAPYNVGVDGPALVPWLNTQNYGPQPQHPKLGATNLPTLNWEKLLPLLARLTDSDILTADDRLEDQVRSIMRLVPRDKKTSRTAPKLLTAESKAGKPGDPNVPLDPASEGDGVETSPQEEANP